MFSSSDDDDFFENPVAPRVEPTSDDDFFENPVAPTSDPLDSFKIEYKDLKFVRKLGHGGYGVVYEGVWKVGDVDVNVAIKQLLKDSTSEDDNKEFIKESQIMAELHAPNIVQYYGYCTEPKHCLVMEYMPNGSLSSVLESER